MFAVKKSAFIVMLCFISSLFSFPLWAQETPNKTSSNQQEAKSKKEEAPAQNHPQISLDSTNFDVGEVYEGGELAHTFTIKNTGTAELTIEKVKPG